MTWTARLVVALLAASSAPAFAQGELPARDFAVRASRVITMAGPELAPGVVVVKDGRIAAVGGGDLAVPEGLPVVDASGQVLLPGFIEAHSQRGLDRSYEQAADASFVRVSDGYNPASLEVEDARRNGITTLLVAPDNRAFLAGRAAILHPQGLSVESAIVKQDAALKISLQPSPGTSRMGHLAKLRQVLDDTKRWMDERAKKEKEGKLGEDEKEIPAQREALVALLSGKLPAWIYCPTAADVSTCFGLAREHGFHVVPVVSPAAWRAAELLRANHVTAIVPPVMDHWETLPSGQVVHVSLPKILSDAKVPFALSTDPAELVAQHPWAQAAACVREGVPREEALAAVTRTPARLLGFGARKGVISAGADADFLLLSDDPLSGTAFVEEAYVRGTRLYARSADDKLKRLRERAPEPPEAAAESDHPHRDKDSEHEGSPVDEAARRSPRGAAPHRPLLADDEAQRWPLPPGTPHP